MPRRVGNDVFARAGGKVTIGDVNRDALFALGLKAVGDERQVDRTHAAARRGFFDRVERVAEDGLGVEQQTADQRALAIVNVAAGQKAQQAGVEVRQVFMDG